MNALVTMTIGESPIWAYTLPPMYAACLRHGWAFEQIAMRKSHLARYSDPAMNLMFEKFQTMDYLDRYDRVLMLDADALMSPHCPDVFEAVPEEAIGGVFEDVGSRAKSRSMEIAKIKELAIDPRLGDWRTGYMNSGVMVLSRCHREALTLDFNDVMVRDVSLRRVFPDQNVMNYLCRRSGWPIVDLGYKWNHMTMFSEDWNGSPDWHDSHILHYAGMKEEERLACAPGDYADWWEEEGG